jgi:uncharacterized membrane protein
MPIILAITIIYHLWYLPIIFIFLAAVMFGILISRIKEIYEDEMTRTINDKAGGATVSLGTIIMTLAGAILLAFSNDNSSGLGIAAITLFSTSFGLSIINLFTKTYYKKKLGGKL